MNVDADSLEQLNLRTRDGAERARAVFGEAVDATASLGATKITLVSQRDLVTELLAEGSDYVEFSLTGELSGTVVISLDSLAAESLGDLSVSVVGADLVDALVAEWSDHVDGPLRVDDPTVVEDPGTHAFGFDTVGEDTESAPVFQSTIHLDSGGRTTLYLAPDEDALKTLLGATDVGADSPEAEETPEFGGATDGGAVTTESSLFGDDETAVIPLDKLSVFGDITRRGTTNAAERVTAMTGIETETEVSGINFTPVDDISSRLDDGEYVGTTTELTGQPSGHLIIMFRAESATDIAEAMLPVNPEGTGLTSMHESALEELGNIVTSGFIDGWANVLQTSVDHTPPTFTSDMDMALVEIVTQQLGPFQTHAYTVESRIRTEAIAFDCQIHALPDEAELSDALNSLLVDRADQTDADPTDLF